jgi:hypothetical protein
VIITNCAGAAVSAIGPLWSVLALALCSGLFTVVKGLSQP